VKAAAGLVSLLVSLVVTLLAGCAGLALTLVVVAVPLWFAWKLYKSGLFDAKVWTTALDNAIPAPGTGSGGDQFVKRTTCKSCGSPKVKPSQSAYVYCDFCGEMMDWDFKAACSDKRSRAPGPAYEGMLATLQPQLDRARLAGDRPAYLEIQKKLWLTYVTACPAAMSPRIGDPRYRDRIVEYQAQLQTEADLDPQVKGAFDYQMLAVRQLVWNRANPFQPKVDGASFDTLLEAVLACQRAYAEKAESTGLLEKHPDHPTREILLRVGVSALVQGWMPYLDKADADRTLGRTGLKGEYIKFEPIEELHGTCEGCSAKLDVPKGAKRVLCHHCGAYAAVGGGKLPCHGCGSPIEISPAAAVIACGSCGATLARMRTAA
jgi:LSD1 subclass zinc finger protein